ncbi:MAG: peptidylprolyl isomerase [Candidatus Hydrogenedentota bacterium]
MKDGWQSTVLRTGLLLAAGVVAWCAPAAAQAPDLDQLDVVERSVPNGPVAIVRNESIGRQAFLRFYRSELSSLAGRTGAAEIADSDRVKIGLQCLARLVQRELLRQEAANRGIEVNDAEVEEAYQEELAALRQSIARREGREVAEEEALEIAGVTPGQMREALRSTLRVDKAFRAVAEEQGIDVSSEEINTFYEENPKLFNRPDSVHLKQIFVRPEPNAESASEEQWAQARKKAEKALARVRAGEKFETVAKDMSDSPDAAQGGDVGFTPVEHLPAVYQDVVATLDVGQLSEILRSEHGFHIVQVVAKKGGEKVALSEAEARVRRALRHAKAEDAVAAWSDSIINNQQQVKIFLHLENTLAARRVNANP